MLKNSEAQSNDTMTRRKMFQSTEPSNMTRPPAIILPNPRNVLIVTICCELPNLHSYMKFGGSLNIYLLKLNSILRLIQLRFHASIYEQTRVRAKFHNLSLHLIEPVHCSSGRLKDHIKLWEYGQKSEISKNL
ncbi:hypothetical protein KC19_4G098700 [Ceratodon purpureus]|uniref:Uncharacterized protein n=1 Tax=Ceratodon purpureus TaxID=3225 RepID=A0A8T0IAD2_CERPU|nr:hypothetical protein KC19_4G098700 [Ceratodon purpureus]